MISQIDLSLFRFHEPIAVRWSDFDMLGHTNNAIYSTYLETTRIHYLRTVGPWPWEVTGMVLARTEMDFLKELKPTDEPVIYMRISRLGTKSFDFESVIVDKKDPDRLYNHAKVVVVTFDQATKKTTTIPEDMRKVITAYEPAL